MIIKKLYVNRFGKLKNLHIELKDGLNIIYGENEAGKSTLQAFIKAMFYGMNSQKKKIRENDRKRFLPWSEEKASGELYFEDDYKNEYMIKRTFGKKRREDESIVLDAITGKAVGHIDHDIPGISIFGLGEESFEKTVFIRQLMSEVKRDKEDEIMKRLTNLKNSADEDVSFYKALNHLEKLKKSLIHSRKTGKIDKLKEDYAKIQEEWGEGIRLQEENLEDQIQLNEKIEQKRMLQHRINQLEEKKKKWKQLRIYKEYKKLIEYKNKIKKLLKDKESLIEQLKFGNDCIDEVFIENIKAKKIQWMKQKNICDIKKVHKESLEARIEEKKDYLKDNIKNIWKVLFLGIFIVLGGFLLGWTKNAYYYGLSGIGIVLFIYGFKKKKSVASMMKQMEKELNNIEKAFQVQKESLENIKKEMMRKLRPFYKGNIEIEQIDPILKHFQELLNKKIEIERQIFTLEDIYQSLLQGRDFENMKKAFKSFTEELEEIIDEESIEALLKEEVQKLITLEKEIKDLEHRVQTRFYGRKNIAELEEEMERIKEKIGNYEDVLASLDIAIETLQDSFKEIQKSFGLKLNKVVGDILREITKNKYDALKISEDYEVKIIDSKEDQIKDIAYFSNGTWDQIYFALRIGIAKLIIGEEKTIPLIIDDAFVQYDDKRLDAVLRYLYQYAKEHQVVMFTCQKREIEKLKNFSGIHVIYL
ncbi:AAA family ATPase [Crassaminicella thermophila]|uniref:AAA family ATPase n=1 Tax=Crassaminicella thermophila TaxID=2599308 RepID=A0A5C0SG11_CRATE|nr:AAA family ATPase [Crassaminicella thermophila]QEK12862.1 AAA family ATPase [Crassaminicella thermophila]